MTASENTFWPRALSLAGVSLVAAQLAAQTPGYQNPDLPFERRVADLVSRITLEEKVSQVRDVAPAIARLGIPAYNWWNEALHGVARSGLATSFPQAIGLAATWDDSLIFRMATVISDEARAKHNEYVRQGSRERYQGLTFWSPNINLFRDPRWGRGQETYGEDPFLTGLPRREMGSIMWPFLTRGPRRVLSRRYGRPRLGHHRIVFRPVAHRGLVGRAAKQGHA